MMLSRTINEQERTLSGQCHSYVERMPRTQGTSHWAIRGWQWAAYQVYVDGNGPKLCDVYYFSSADYFIIITVIITVCNIKTYYVIRSLDTIRLFASIWPTGHPMLWWHVACGQNGPTQWPAPSAPPAAAVRNVRLILSLFPISMRCSHFRRYKLPKDQRSIPCTHITCIRFLCWPNEVGPSDGLTAVVYFITFNTACWSWRTCCGCAGPYSVHPFVHQ